MDEHTRANQALWDEKTEIHKDTPFYDLPGFIAGKNALQSIELEEMGDVKGKSLLHLQCHFGMDTLSWARLGAKVTGVDFSPKAIELAKSISAEIDVPGRFIQSEVYTLPDVLDEQFDIVFTSYGVLVWLGDLVRWGQVIEHFLKPGGTFYIAEMHPFAMTLDNETEDPVLQFMYPYFHSAEPMKFETAGTYADPDADVIVPFQFEWSHSMGDIINALTSAGLQIEYLHEFPFCAYQMLPFMEKREDGWWHLPEGMPELPLMFSIKASKPGD